MPGKLTQTFRFLKIASTISHEKSSASTVNPPRHENLSDSHSIFTPLLSSHVTGYAVSFHYRHQQAKTVRGEISSYIKDRRKHVNTLH